MPRFNSETASAAGKIGGVKSGEIRRKKKAMREDLEYLLDKAMRGYYIDPGTDATSIEKLAARHGKNISAQQAMLVAIMVKAANGDIEAAKFIRDTVGEKQAEKIETSISYEDYVKNHKIKFKEEEEKNEE